MINLAETTLCDYSGVLSLHENFCLKATWDTIIGRFNKSLVVEISHLIFQKMWETSKVKVYKRK